MARHSPCKAVRGGRKRTYKTAKEYKAHLRQQVLGHMGHNPDGLPQRINPESKTGNDAMGHWLFYGSKGDKPAGDRRPFKGGRVKPLTKLERGRHAA